MIDRILWCCSLNSIKTWLYNWHNLKYAWCMVRLDTQVQLLLSGRDMLFSPHTVSRCHGNSQAKREHLERKTISLASYSGKHRKNTTWEVDFLQLWIWAKVKSWIHASSCFSGWFKPHGPCESGVNQGAYLRYYVLQGFRISSVWCSRGWHTFGVFFLLWKVLKLASEFGFLWVSSIFEDWHGLKKAIWGQWSKEPNSTLFVNTRYWLIWICWWLTSMRIWIWRRNWRRWRCFGCEEIGFATLNRVCRCPSAGIWLLTTIAKTKSQQVAFVLLMLHVSFDAQPNSNFLLKSRGNFMAVMGRSEMNISTRLLLCSALDVTWGKGFDSWNAPN